MLSLTMLRAGHGLMLIVIALLAIGVVMVTSAGLTIGGGGGSLDMASILTGRPARYAVLAVILMLVAARIPVSALLRNRGLVSPVPWILAGSFILLVIVHVPGVGHEVNGARRWISLGSIGFQPSELVKWGMPLVVAWYATRRAGVVDQAVRGFIVPLAIVGAACLLIATEDLGTAVLVGTVGAVMLFAAGAKLRHALLLLPVGVAGFAAAVVTSPYRVARLQAFLDPYQDPRGIGYHVIQSMAAVAGGGLTGRGLGGGVQKFGYLPEDTTDFIFAIVAEELGVVGSLLVLSLYAVLLLCGLAVIQRQAHPFHRLLGLGIILTIGLQAVINLFVVTGMAPTKGIALPLVSSGGTGWCLTAFAIGLLASMDRAAPAPDPDPVEHPPDAPTVSCPT